MMTRMLTMGVMSVAASAALAGPLDPPPGPITPTNRMAIAANTTPGDADSVYRITQRGSYYLVGDVTGAAGKSGIEIAASDVTIDLNGFSLIGVGGSLDGVRVDGTRYSLTVKNGRAFGWGGDGFNAQSAHRSHFVDLTATNNGDEGIRVGDRNIVDRCIADNNASHGVNTGHNCMIRDSVAQGNGGVGLDVDDNSSISDSQARDSGGHGVSAGSGSTIRGCSAQGNGGNGIDAGSYTTVVDCAARGNTGNGVSAFQRCVVRDTTSSANTLAGFLLSFSNHLSGCSADFNSGHGIRVEGGANYIVNNIASQQANTSNGIYITANVGNRVEGNHCIVNQGHGIRIMNDSTNNFVIRNTVGGNGFANISVVNANNEVAAIISSPGQNFTSSNAWANIAY